MPSPATSPVSKLSPALGNALRSGATTTDQLLVELVDQFKLDAMAIDPTILGVWLYRDMTMLGRDPSGAVQGLFIERKHSPLRQSDLRA